MNLIGALCFYIQIFKNTTTLGLITTSGKHTRVRDSSGILLFLL